MGVQPKMPRRAGLLHVRSHLVWSVKFYGYLIDAHDKGEIVLPPIYFDEVRKLKFLAEAILRKNAVHREATGSRKDVYVETN